MPKIRHLAIVCMDPDERARFYYEVFDMKGIGRNGLSTTRLTMRAVVGGPPQSRASS